MSNPFVNYLVSEMRGLDMILTPDLSHICDIIAVGSYSLDLRQVQEICHEVIPKDLRLRIIQSFGYHAFRELGESQRRAVVIMALPPNADATIVESVLKRSDYDMMTRSFEKQTLLDIICDIRMPRDSDLGFYQNSPDKTCSLAWLGYRVFPNISFKRLDLMRLERYITKGFSSPIKPLGDICNEINQAIQQDFRVSGDTLLKALRKLEPYFTPVPNLEETP